MEFTKEGYDRVMGYTKELSLVLSKILAMTAPVINRAYRYNNICFLLNRTKKKSQQKKTCFLRPLFKNSV
jgi:hypothetical protein